MPATKQAIEQAKRLKLHIPQLDNLEERLLEWTSQDKFQACIIKVMRYGIPVFEGCYGTSTNNSGVHMDTICPVFSDTKPVVAALIMALLEEGRLDLGDSISKFLPEYSNGGRQGITLVHLLTHTHGMDDAFFNSMDDYVKDELKIERPGDEATGDDWNEYRSKIKKALDLPEDCSNEKLWETVGLRVELKNEPGKVMAYSNYGYDRLRDIICAITGESIDSYAKRTLFDPLGMVDSYWTLPEEKWERVLGRGERCTGYGWINAESCYRNQGGGNGLKTTVNDMSRFCEMILGEGRFNGHRIISPASVKQMISNYNSSLKNPWDSWGLGWNYRGIKVDDSGVLRSSDSIEHGGWAGHKVLVDRKHGLSIVCFTGEYSDGVFPGFGRVHNMVIAAFDE